MSKPIIWETDFVRAFEKYRAAVSYKPYEDGASMEVREVFGSVLRRMSAGRPAQRDELPDHLFVNEERTKLPKTGLPDFFYARSLRIISEEVRTLLDAF